MLQFGRARAKLASLDATHPHEARTVALLSFARSTGLRAEELCLAQLGDFEVVANGSDTFTVINTRGKGDKMRQVPVVDPQVLAALERHLQHRGFSMGAMAGNADVYLFGALTGGRDGLSYSTLHRLIRAFFASMVSDAGEAVPQAYRDKLAKASTHWMRHCFASYALQDGVPIHMVSELLGHSSEETTRIYAVDSIARKANAMRNGLAQRAVEATVP